MKYDEVLEINGIKLTKKYIQSLNQKEREDLIDPIFEIIRKNGWMYMDNISSIKKSYKNLIEYQPDLSLNELFNNSSLATDVCKYYCHSFYDATELNKNTMIENFNNDDILKRIIKNRLGLDWLISDGVNESFNLSFKMIAVQGQRSMRFVNQTSIFKPSIAKYMALKYSEKNDVIFDPSCGFGARLLGATTANRKYIGTDPLTVPELNVMCNELGISANLIHCGSENYCGDENSIDLVWTSPPYYKQEFYSKDKTQAYNNGEDYFYNTYWKKTLDNAKFMLKPGKWFGLNIKNVPKMLNMAVDVFGEIDHKVALRTVRSHLNKKNVDPEKFEYIYMFKNNK